MNWMPPIQKANSSLDLKKNNLVLQTNFNGKETTNGENSLSWSI